VICEQGKKAKVVVKGVEVIEADLVIGADGVNSRLREILQGREEEPIKTGDLAYRLLLDTKKMLEDEELRGFVEDPQVNYWLGPDMHAGMFFSLSLSLPSGGGRRRRSSREGEIGADKISKISQLCPPGW